jgi:hypothetical protein
MDKVSRVHDDRYMNCIASCVRHNDGTFWNGDVRCTHPVLFTRKEPPKRFGEGTYKR